MKTSPLSTNSHSGFEAKIHQGLASSPDGDSRFGTRCPLCGFDDWTYLFIVHNAPVHRCGDCGLTRLYPPPSKPDIQKFYSKSTGHNPFENDSPLADSLTEQEACSSYLRMLERHGTPRSGLLAITPKGHPFAVVADQEGYKVETAIGVEELSRTPLPEGYYASAVMIFQLEKALNPVSLLEQIHAALKPDGLLFLVTPSMDSWSAHFFGSMWTEWRPENLYYFDMQTIQGVLLKSGFSQIQVRRDHRRYSLQHLYDRAKAFPKTALTRLVQSVHRVLPASLHRSVRLKLTTSGMVVVARRTERRTRPLLSIIMPVYNEHSTFTATLNSVLAKEIPGIDKEVVVVESNSTDGTRPLALEFQDHPGVKLVLEDRPKGKGGAVRKGFASAEGDLILIQDADQEYDVNDYDALIEPLRTYKRAFVLGSRHIGNWKIRRFNAQPGITAYFNFGHFLFVGLVNILYGQSLKDPFTMYKVFRRDCLHGLYFECNRFDFDFELVIKLVRKGYRPLEIPVNYIARSFAEGKKVSMLRDPLTWLRALVKYRFTKITVE